MKKENLTLEKELPLKDLQGNGTCSYSETVDFEKFLKEIKL